MEVLHLLSQTKAYLFLPLNCCCQKFFQLHFSACKMEEGDCKLEPHTVSFSCQNPGKHGMNRTRWLWCRRSTIHTLRICFQTKTRLMQPKFLPPFSWTLCEHFTVYEMLTLNPDNSHPPQVHLDCFPLQASPKSPTARSPQAVGVESCPRSKGGGAGGAGVAWAVALQFVSSQVFRPTKCIVALCAGERST